MMPDPLTQVQRAALARKRAEAAYLAAIARARETNTLEAVAKAAGTTRQNIHQITRKARQTNGKAAS